MIIRYCISNRMFSAQGRLSRRRSESPAPSKLLLSPDISRHPSNSSLENEPLDEDCNVNDDLETMDHDNVEEEEEFEINVED